MFVTDALGNLAVKARLAENKRVEGEGLGKGHGIEAQQRFYKRDQGCGGDRQRWRRDVPELQHIQKTENGVKMRFLLPPENYSPLAGCMAITP